MKTNLKTSLMTELTILAKGFREGQQDYLQAMRRLKSKRKELTKFDDGQDLDDNELRTAQEIEDRVQYDPVRKLKIFLTF
jgi:hypothetical protein